MIYGWNINEKYFETNHIPNISSTNTQDLAARLKLVSEHYFKSFKTEYLLALKEQHFYVNRCCVNYEEDLRGDVVLYKAGLVPQMRWIKLKVVGIMKGRNNLITGVEPEVYQLNLNKTITINIPCNT